MLKFINKIVAWFLKLQNFFFFIQAFQAGLQAFGNKWTELTGQKMEDILKETEKNEKSEVK